MFAHLDLIVVAAALLVSVAAIVDFRYRRVPNWLTFGALAIGLVGNTLQSGPSGGLLALVGAFLGFALLLPFYLLRAIGAGDVKLLAGLGALLGPEHLLAVAVYAAIVGGVLSLVILARNGRLGLTLYQLFVQRVVPARSGLKAPYGIAIAGGVYLTLLVPLAVSSLAAN